VFHTSRDKRDEPPWRTGRCVSDFAVIAACFNPGPIIVLLRSTPDLITSVDYTGANIFERGITLLHTDYRVLHRMIRNLKVIIYIITVLASSY
jgi:hypothetical protein